MKRKNNKKDGVIELSDFIKKTIADVIKGLEEAETEKYKFGLYKDKGIEFDVAVVGKSSTGVKAGLKIFSIGTGVEKRISNSNVHRIKFRVRVRGKKPVITRK